MKVKVILMKAYILFCLFWMLAVLYVLCRVEWGINPEWEKAAFIMIGIWFCLAMSLVYFVPKVDLYPSSPLPKPRHENDVLPYTDPQKNISLDSAKPAYKI